MPDKKLEELTLRELTARLHAIDQERDQIVKLIRTAAEAIGVVSAGEPAETSGKRSRSGQLSNKEAVQSILADGKIMETKKLVNEVVAKTGGKSTSAHQFLYSPAGKKVVTHTKDGWKLK